MASDLVEVADGREFRMQPAAAMWQQRVAPTKGAACGILADCRLSMTAPDGDYSLDILTASLNGDERVVKDLLVRDISLVNTRGGGNATPLHGAAFNGHVKVVKVLLENGGDVRPLPPPPPLHHYFTTSFSPPPAPTYPSHHHPNYRGQTNPRIPIHPHTHASSTFPPCPPSALVLIDWSRCLAELMSQYCRHPLQKVRAMTNNMETPAHWAAALGRKAVMEMLIAYGAELEAQDGAMRHTPLEKAKANNHIEVNPLPAPSDVMRYDTIE